MYSKDIVKEFIYECELRKLSKRTIKGYRNNNLQFMNYVESQNNITELEEINHLHIKEYFRYLMEKGLTEIYINGILKCLRAFFKYCMQEGYISKNPCLKVSWQKEEKVIIKTFNDEEIIKMLNVFDYSDYLNARNKCLIAFLVDTGARCTETCEVLNQDIKETTIIIHGKGNKERYVGISPMLKKIMIRYERIKEFYFKDKILKYDNYFLSKNGHPLTVEAVERVIKDAGIKAGIRQDIRCSPHTIRHYFAQKQLKNGLDVYSLSRLLGHENISITKRYLQSLQDNDIVQMSIKTSPLMNLIK